MTVTIQMRGGTAADWTTADPILAEREMGIETDTSFYKIGDGSTAWTALPYAELRSIDEGTVIVMADQSTPTAPAAGELNLYADKVNGQMQLMGQMPDGTKRPFQSSLATMHQYIISTGGSTSLTALGCVVSTSGTVSHPAVSNVYGNMFNIISAASLNGTCGTGTSIAPVHASPGLSSAGGFFYYSRLAYPDSSYNNTVATTGTRIWNGVTSNTLVTQTNGDTVSGAHAGFWRRHVNGGTLDTNWQFATKATAGSQNTIDTGMAFTVQNVYDFWIYLAPGSTEIFWRVDNVTASTTAEGSTSTGVPEATTALRAGNNIITINAAARNVRMQKMYVEVPR